MLALALLLLLASIIVVGLVIAWHPDAHDPVPEVDAEDPRLVLDLCEHVYATTDGVWLGSCTRPATHELSGDITSHVGGGNSAMVATYCAEHAPEGAVRVRTLAPR